MLGFRVRPTCPSARIILGLPTSCPPTVDRFACSSRVEARVVSQPQTLRVTTARPLSVFLKQVIDDQQQGVEAYLHSMPPDSRGTGNGTVPEYPAQGNSPPCRSRDDDQDLGYDGRRLGGEEDSVETGNRPWSLDV